MADGTLGEKPKSAWVKATEADKRTQQELRMRTLWQTISDAAALAPNKTALVGADAEGRIQRLTFAELLKRVRHFSAGLASIGVQRGDRVVLWMTNRMEWIISAFAAARIGAATVPVNTFLRAPEVKYCISQSGARHLIMLDTFRALDMPEMLKEICPAFSDATTPGGLYSSDLPDLRNVVMFSRVGTHQPGTFDWNNLEAIGRDGNGEWLTVADTMAAAVTPDDLHMIKYTSGSTGFPKGVMLLQGRWVANGLMHSRRTGMCGNDIYFSMMPFFHAGGSMYGQMSMLPIGGTLVFTEAFSIDLALSLIQQEKATIFVSVLGKEVVMAAHEKGISFPDVWLGQVFNEAAKSVLPNARFSFMPFGLTETYGPACLTGPDDPIDKQMTTSGRPLEGNEIRVVNPTTGEDVAPGEIGEAWIRGNIMPSYWNKPEESLRAIDTEGWLHSEDLVSVDAEGFVTYRGRLKLMAKVGGENVSLEEVEKVIVGHEAITHCAAVSVPDQRKVEAVRVYVIRRADIRICADELQLWLKPRLAHFKMPREIVFVDELPRLGNGKLDRMILSQWAKEELAA
ncbi:MAG TPA: class I adenylate-forming enzyme family protein [Sphingobium sp.]|uniref:class I adenylate-forming enzyme family protein n=1 Tax=Sphingobium sp. TaxID=1912891 RepID=UPI002ED46777